MKGATSSQPAANGPGRFFADHPVLYWLSQAGTTMALVVFARRAAGASRPVLRFAWASLGTLQVVQVAGLWWIRRSARPRPRRG